MKFIKLLDLLGSFLEAQIQGGRDQDAHKANHQLLANIEFLEKTSGKITSWSLSILGGSFLAILSDEFVHPEMTYFKLGYFLFVPAWLFTIISISNGLKVSGALSAAKRNESVLELLVESFKHGQCHQRKQIRWFKAALIVYGSWLLAYLTWWVLTDLPIKKLINL
jgi:hypothetical protein